MSEAEVTSDEAAPLPDLEDPPPPPYRHTFSWLVQLRDGRLLRVDADRCTATSGVLVFYTGPREELMSACFEYGDWRRVAIMDREAASNAGWHVLKEGRKRT